MCYIHTTTFRCPVESRNRAEPCLQRRSGRFWGENFDNKCTCDGEKPILYPLTPDLALEKICEDCDALEEVKTKREAEQRKEEDMRRSGQDESAKKQDEFEKMEEEIETMEEELAKILEDIAKKHEDTEVRSENEGISKRTGKAANVRKGRGKKHWFKAHCFVQ